MRVLVLEDDPVWRAEVEGMLRGAGHSFASCSSGAAFKAELQRDSFDLLLLDWNLPEITGYDLLLWARSRFTPCPPVIMITSRTDPEDIVRALNAGADDFVIKPCNRDVLIARISAVVRRAYPFDASAGGTVELSGAIFDEVERCVTINGEAVSLTETEFNLALALFRNIGRAMGRAHLLELIWGASPDTRTRTLDVHISKIRTRLGLRAENGFRLLPIYRFGYRLERMPSNNAVETP